ncbi:MAG: hypothetical protein R3C26_10445 [Calditrichia bacterium]
MMHGVNRKNANTGCVMTAIASMGWLAAARWDQLQSPAALGE